MNETQSERPETHDSAALERLMKVLWVGTFLGLIGLGIAQATGLLAAIGIGVLIFLASFASGCFFGFLFGVPRVLSREPSAGPSGGSNTGERGSEAPVARSSGDAPLSSDTNPTTGARLLQSNANLERISDWLTTLLVGAALVELHRINNGLLMFREFLTGATVFRDQAGNATAGALPIVGPIVLVFGVACGFLYMYLNTRLVLVRLFQAIEDLLSGGHKLSASEQRAVKAIVTAGDGVGDFIRQQFTVRRSPTIEDALNLMFDLLYKSNPDRVIEIGTELSNTDAVHRPDYWFYLAAAFGQKLHRLDSDSDEWRSARDNALDCARRAVGLDPHYRERLWRISDRKSTDNDLAPLRDDPEFLRIIGRN